MPNYKYRAMSSDGSRVEGSYDAYTENEVLEMIKNQGLYPLKIDQVVESKTIEFNFNQKITTRDIAVFCRQFYTMLDSGITVSKSLEILSNQVENKRLKVILKDMDEDVRKGISLSEAMEKQDNCFPVLLIKMVEAGEASGNLDDIMLRMATHLEK